VEALEQRITALKNTPVATGDVCPKCKQKTFELMSTEPVPIIGQLGVQKRVYKCPSCSFEESKSVDTFSP
jgi:ribosomal protein L37AE/L43A